MSITHDRPAAPRDRTPLAAGLDTAVVVAFVAIGRRNHDQDPGIGELVETAAPFLIALAVSWIALRAWNRPTEVTTGVRLWIGTIAVGMVLRRAVFDDGTAVAFVLVATAFVGALLVGWRGALHLAIARRRPPT